MRRTPIRCLTAAVLLVAADAVACRAQAAARRIACLAQTAASQAEVPKPAAAKPLAVPTAAEILVRAIRRQGVPTGVDPAADLPLALRAKVTLQFRDNHGNDVSFAAERRFVAPDRIWTELRDPATGTVTLTGFDGRKPWLYSKSTGLRPLDGPQAQNDLKQLTTDVEVTAALARSFLLRQLQHELRDLRRLEYVTQKDMTAWVIEGDAVVDMDGKKRKSTLRLYVEQKEARLMGVRAMIEGQDTLQICFTKHETVNGVDVPRKIEIYRNDAPPPPELTLYVNDLDLAPKFKDADFAPPEK